MSPDIMERPDKKQDGRGTRAKRSIHIESSNGSEAMLEMDDGRRRLMENNLDTKIQYPH